MQDSNDFLDRFLKRMKNSKNNEEFLQLMDEEMKRKGMNRQ